MLTWITAFVDVSATRYDATARFWAGVTGSTLSPVRGAEGEFATLVPPDGDAYLRLQRLGGGRSGVHLDLHDPEQASELGLRSPGGLPWCRTTDELSTRPLPRIWAGGQASLVDQVCLDVPADRYDEECEFWAAATGWEVQVGSRPEFRTLVRPAAMPLRIILQRLEESDGVVGAHLDVATTDRAAETDRHRELGARVEATRARWTVLRDPAGTAYCITDRDPYTGVLPPE